MLETMKSFRDKMQSIKKSAKEVELDQSSTSASKPGPSKQSDNLPPNPAPNTHSERTDEEMKLDVYAPSLSPRLRDAQSEHGSDPNHGSDHHSDISDNPNRCVRPEPKKHLDKRKHKVWAKYISQSSSSGGSVLCSQEKVFPSELDQPQHDPDPHFYRKQPWPSQYAEEVETFRHMLDLSDPRETTPRSSTSVLGLDDQKGQH